MSRLNEVRAVVEGRSRWTMYRGDCREVLDVLEAVPLVFADPTYSSGARRDAERQVRGSMLRSLEDADWFSHDAMTTWGFTWFLRSLLAPLRERLAPGAHVYLFADWRQTPNVYGMLESTGYRVNHCLVWDKGQLGMGAYWRNQHEHVVFGSNGMPSEMLDHGRGSVLCFPPVAPARRIHPTEKPIDLCMAVLEAVPGALVFDPFAGTAPIGAAALRLGRRYIGCEINPEHHGKGVARLRAEERETTIDGDAAGQVPLFGR